MSSFIAENSRIGLIPYSHDDDADMLLCWQDIDTQKGYNHIFSSSLSDLSRVSLSDFPFWVVVVEKSNCKKIGVLRLSGDMDFPDLAIWVYPEHRRMGFGTDAISLSLDYLFHALHFRTIYAGCYIDNIASQKMLAKCGFIRHPAGDQSEINCFTGAPTIQLSFSKVFTIETKDLILREGSTEDWYNLYRNLWSREEVFRYLFSKPCSSEEEAKKRTAAYCGMHKEIKTEFFVCEKESGQAIGIAGVKGLKPEYRTITDIAIGPEFQGKGYGKQIVECLVHLAFEQGAAEVAYACFAQNSASKALALSCDFSYSHSEEAELSKNGEPVILDNYKITR